MWWKKKVSPLPVNMGIWPNGEPQFVRDMADRSNGPRGYDVSVLLMGGFDVYDVLAVFEDRQTARCVAHAYNAAYGIPGDITRWARIEETSFYRAEEKGVSPMTDPNMKIYLLKWRNGAPYAHPRDHRTEFTLAEAMRIAEFENVDVIDSETGQVIWRGSEATRGSVC